jgi:hypothetical protein
MPELKVKDRTSWSRDRISWFKVLIVAIPFCIQTILLANSVVQNTKAVPKLKTRISCLEASVQINQEENNFLIKELIKKVLPTEQAEQVIALAELHKRELQKTLETRIKEDDER